MSIGAKAADILPGMSMDRTVSVKLPLEGFMAISAATFASLFHDVECTIGHLWAITSP